MAATLTQQGAPSTGMPNLPNAKASAAPPKVTGDDNMELKDVGPQEGKLPLHEDVMQLARIGEIASIQKLFDEGNVDAKYRDKEGITPLHVSSSNITESDVRQCRNDRFLVGSYQQPVRRMQILDRSWGRCQRKGWRF